MPCFIASCYAVFCSYHWEASSFLKGNGAAVDLGEIGGGVRTGRSGGKGGCGGDGLHERRIN